MPASKERGQVLTIRGLESGPEQTVPGAVGGCPTKGTGLRAMAIPSWVLLLKAWRRISNGARPLTSAISPVHSLHRRVVSNLNQP